MHFFCQNDPKCKPQASGSDVPRSVCLPQLLAGGTLETDAISNVLPIIETVQDDLWVLARPQGSEDALYAKICRKKQHDYEKQMRIKFKARTAYPCGT